MLLQNFLYKYILPCVSVKIFIANFFPASNFLGIYVRVELSPTIRLVYAEMVTNIVFVLHCLVLCFHGEHST